MSGPDFDLDNSIVIGNHTGMSELGESDEPMSMEELLEEYRNVRNPKRTTSVRISPEKKAEEDAYVAQANARAETAFSQMVNLATEQIFSTPSDQRLGYLSDLRKSFHSPNVSQSLTLVEIDNFSDRLTVSVMSKLTPPKP